MSIKINNMSIRIRPSAVDSFYGCAYQWGKTFLEGISSIPNSRAAIGTAIHAGIEASWRDAMAHGKANHNLSAMSDAAVSSFKEETANGCSFGNDETVNTCHVEIIGGIKAWVEDIAPFVPVPEAVETFLKVDIQNHPFVSEVGGTLDYLGHGVIDDVKTSKRKVTGSSYDTQQAIYKYLAEANGHQVLHSRLQNVVLTKSPAGQILTIEPNVGKAKSLVNGMLDVLELVAKDIVPIELLLRGNPKYTFCSDKYCAHYDNCPWVRGKVAEPRKADIAAIKL
ncbi:PD-(D/E)XK nuclease superfamily protein [Edwardsiella phage ETP-1]|uniref:PD-(D/E)XK nuclease superfamily protein n=1 Tax=Edwardsiella phage ETP-1 TaxID=2544920 RepID=A0A6G5P4C2_9CAUD|nr:PD-(D/E)XK nuclease superfamily protein [Edwardsiella phage ETP-1]UIS54082.1 PD-(D/E)XK nuclease superfamily protein [Edwardsiella phage vB_EpP_ZHX]